MIKYNCLEGQSAAVNSFKKSAPKLPDEGALFS